MDWATACLSLPPQTSLVSLNTLFCCAYRLLPNPFQYPVPAHGGPMKWSLLVVPDKFLELKSLDPMLWTSWAVCGIVFPWSHRVRVWGPSSAEHGYSPNLLGALVFFHCACFWLSFLNPTQSCLMILRTSWGHHDSHTVGPLPGAGTGPIIALWCALEARDSVVNIEPQTSVQIPSLPLTKWTLLTGTWVHVNLVFT